MTSPVPETLLICPLTASDLAGMRDQMHRAADAGADAVELRLDFLTHTPSPEDLQTWIRQAPLKVLATCRPQRQGGHYEGEESDRLAFLAHASRAGADWIDVESDVPEPQRPQGHTILSFHDFQQRPGDLADLLQQMEDSTGKVCKIAFAADNPQDALVCFDLLRRARKPTLALAMGESGQLSRLAARKFGAFGTFASLDAASGSAPGQPTLEAIRSLYRWKDVTASTQLYGVIGCPVGHSMSPAIHNAALAQTALDGLYVPLRIENSAEHFARFLDGVRERPWLDWRGLSVTLPHKEHALAYVGEANCDELTRKIGAVNTLTLQPDGEIRGTNTDYAAAIESLCKTMEIGKSDLSALPCALLGAGGVARALLAALTHYGAEVTLYNRTLRRAEALAEEFGAHAAPLADVPSSQAQVLINCTSVGMHPDIEACPIDTIPPDTRVVFDTIYNPVQTRLLTMARAAGRRIVTGVDMFVEQGAAQFEIWTGLQAPREIMRNVILENLDQTSGD